MPSLRKPIFLFKIYKFVKSKSGMLCFAPQYPLSGDQQMQRSAKEGHKSKGRKPPTGGHLMWAGFGSYFFLHLEFQLEKVC